jgi:hypothetical protein
MPNPPSTESLIWEARARIMWGEKPHKVKEYLTENGVEQRMIDDIIKVSLKERASEIRQRGVTELLCGVGIALLGGSGFGAMYLIGYWHSKVFAACGLAVAYGLFRLIRGLSWVSDGSNMRGSITDMGE